MLKYTRLMQKVCILARGVLVIGTIDPTTFEVASFPAKTVFKHFENPEHPSCFACNSRMMLVSPWAVNKHYVLMEATTQLSDGRFVIIPGAWLVFPRVHATTLDEMPALWTEHMKHARRVIGLVGPFNTGDNWGRQAGQTTEHAHTWFIDRHWDDSIGDEEGLLSAGHGLATILLRIKQRGIEPTA